MTLPEILSQAIRLLGEGRDRVVIARGDTDEHLNGHCQVFQMRLRRDSDMGLSAYRCEARSWLGEQWSSWTERRGWLGGGGFDIDDVLAIDWRLEHVP